MSISQWFEGSLWVERLGEERTDVTSWRKSDGREEWQKEEHKRRLMACEIGSLLHSNLSSAGVEVVIGLVGCLVDGVAAHVTAGVDYEVVGGEEKEME